MTKIIPAQSVTTCDVCNVECNDTNRKRLMTVEFIGENLNQLGQRVTKYKDQMDLCDNCFQCIMMSISGRKSDARRVKS